MQEHAEPVPRSMWASALLVASQSFLFGYCFSCLNACLVTGDNTSGSDCFNGEDSSCPAGTIYNDINLSTIEASLATALTVLGAWIGCMVGSKPSELKGRKFALLANTVFFIAGAVLSSLGNIYTLMIGRFLSGLGVGVASVVPPVLLSEIASPATRGTITTLHQLLLTLGIFISSVLGYGFVTYVDHGWQYIQAFSAIPALCCLALHSYVPESPKWLLSNAGSHAVDVADHTVPLMASDHHPSRALAHDILVRLRPVGHNVQAELDAMLMEAKQDAANTSEVTWTEVFQCKTAVVIGCGLMLFQAITGINSVVFYSTTIFELAGFSESIIGTTIFGLLNFLMTLVTAGLIDKMGRRVLLLTGNYIVLFALVLLSTVLLSPIESTAQGVVAVIAVMVYVVGFAIGLGAVVWTILSEIMPTRLRMKAMSLFLSLNWGSNLAISLLTLTAIDGLGGVHGGMDDDAEADAEKRGVAILYLVFAGCTVASVLFIHMFVPETKGSNPEDFSS